MLVTVRSFVVFFYESHNSAVKEVERVLAQIKLRVKSEKLVAFEATLAEVYEPLDNSAALKKRISIEKSIYAFEKFEKNRKVKVAEARVVTKKKSREFQRGKFCFSRVVSFAAPRDLLSSRRRSRTLDLSGILFRKSRAPSPAESSKRVARKNKLANVFFLVNFLQIEEDFQDQTDFLKFFIDFYFQVKRDFTEFSVA